MSTQKVFCKDIRYYIRNGSLANRSPAQLVPILAFWFFGYLFVFGHGEWLGILRSHSSDRLQHQ